MVTHTSKEYFLDEARVRKTLRVHCLSRSLSHIPLNRFSKHFVNTSPVVASSPWLLAIASLSAQHDPSLLPYLFASDISLGNVSLLDMPASLFGRTWCAKRSFCSRCSGREYPHRALANPRFGRDYECGSHQEIEEWPSIPARSCAVVSVLCASNEIPERKPGTILRGREHFKRNLSSEIKHHLDNHISNIYSTRRWHETVKKHYTTG